MDGFSGSDVVLAHGAANASFFPLFLLTICLAESQLTLDSIIAFLDTTREILEFFMKLRHTKWQKRWRKDDGWKGWRGDDVEFT